MNIVLDEVHYDDYLDQEILYSLLEERTPQQSISHKGMPTWDEHKAFVESRPYIAWYFIIDEMYSEVRGACYLSKDNEIGIFIFEAHHGEGYGKAAIKALMEKYPNVEFKANINPNNEASKKFFESLGFEHITTMHNPDTGEIVQVTYAL